MAHSSDDPSKPANSNSNGRRSLNNKPDDKQGSAPKKPKKQAALVPKHGWRPAQLAASYGVSVSFVRKQIREERLIAGYFGSCRVISDDERQRWASERGLARREPDEEPDESSPGDDS